MYVLFVEDQVPSQTKIDQQIEKHGLYYDGKPAGSIFATRADQALEKVGLVADWADLLERGAWDNWDDIDADIQRKLKNTPVKENLIGICCDLEMPSRANSAAVAIVGANLVKLFHHWRTVQNSRIKLIVYTSYPDWRTGLDSYCDGFHDK